MNIQAEINHGLTSILQLCADLIVKDIMNHIATKKRITGGPQKSNAPSTIKKKGHDHQLRGTKDTFLKKITYITKINPDGSGGEIYFDYPAENGGNVGLYVTRKGYEFFGVSDKAQRDCRLILKGWFRGSVIPLIRREMKRGIKNA